MENEANDQPKDRRKSKEPNTPSSGLTIPPEDEEFLDSIERSLKHIRAPYRDEDVFGIGYVIGETRLPNPRKGSEPNDDD